MGGLLLYSQTATMLSLPGVLLHVGTARRQMSLCAATRHDWRFAAFVHFCRLFADALHLITFSADRLEAAIVEPAEHPVFLTQLLTSLLNAKAEWQHALWYKLRRQWREHLHFVYTGNPLEHKTFFQLTPSERVRRLCAQNLRHDSCI